MKHSHGPKALATLIALTCFCSAVFAQAGADDFGKREFETKCASCHGASGKGDGQMAKLLQGGQPPDLRSLAKGNAGIFPINRVYTSIEGVNVPGHGSRDMPVWGDEFRAKAGQGVYNPDVWVRIRILALIEYIMRLQVR